MSGVFSAFLVAFKHLIPEHRVSLLGNFVSIRVKASRMKGRKEERWKQRQRKREKKKKGSTKETGFSELDRRGNGYEHCRADTV